MTPSTDKPKDGAGRPRLVTDEQIFGALAAAITEHGPTRWTLDDVGGRLGLTGPAIGYRFGNKHELLRAFAAHQPEATSELFTATAASAPSPREAILNALVGLVSAMNSRAEVANNVAMLSLDLTDEDLAQHARAQAQVIKDRLAALVSRCDGRPDADARSAAEHLYVVWSGAIVTWAVDGDGQLEDWTRAKLNETLEHLDI